MKKLLILVAVFGLLAFGSSVFADVCGVNGVVCANGPIVPQLVGQRHLNPGEEDCPAWYGYSGCVTYRIVGQTK